MAFETKYQEIQLNQICARELAMESSEGDVIVPDVQGDIGKVLLLKTTCSMDSKERTGDKMIVKGTVWVHILYSPAEGKGIESIHTGLPFQHTVRLEYETDCPEIEAEIGESSYYLYHSRKMNVKVTVLIRKKVSRDVLYRVVTGCECDCETEMKSREISCLEQHVCSEQMLAVREQTTLTGSLPDIGRILFYEGKIREPQIRFMTNKAMLQGEIVLSFFYYSIEETLEFAEHVIPFTEVVDAFGVSEEMENTSHMTLSGIQMKAEEDAEGDLRQVFVEAKMNLCFRGEKKQTLCLAEDMFCTEYPLHCQYGTLEWSECISASSKTIELREHISREENTPISKILLLDAATLLCRAEEQGEDTLAEGKTIISVLYQNAEGEYCSFQKELPFSCRLEGRFDRGDLSSCSGHFSYHLLSGTELEIRGAIYIEGTAVKTEKISCTLQADIEDNKEFYENRPSLVISYAQAEDTLWEIAKRYSVSRETIRKANQLESDHLSLGQKILIPR